MNWNPKNTVALIVVLAMFAPGIPAGAHNYSIDWWTIANGGGNAGGERYGLSGTIGQQAPGDMAGGTYRLAGGFWVLDPVQMVYLPLILK